MKGENYQSAPPTGRKKAAAMVRSGFGAVRPRSGSGHAFAAGDANAKTRHSQRIAAIRSPFGMPLNDPCGRPIGASLARKTVSSLPAVEGSPYLPSSAAILSTTGGWV